MQRIQGTEGDELSTSNPQGVSFSELAPGQMLGRYELLLPIASGGMGNVWAARLKGTRGFRKLVAIKTILHSYDDERFEQMLFREALLASQIHHPNVVETLELGEHQGMLYLVMELIQGESLGYILREALGQGNGVPLRVGVQLVGQVCRGLQAAHDLCDEAGQRVGLVHRDISPPNVLVTYNGAVKIVDFGVATTTSSVTLGSGEIKGKISYLAPEQLRGDPVDCRVDIFTTGILLYLLTVGRHPFRSATEAQTIHRILDPEPATPPSALVEDYPDALEAVVLRALQKDREARFQSAAEFLTALEQAMPDAFGPDAESRVADYVKELLKARMAERRATLRIAEELAEKSTQLTSRSVPAMVAMARTESKPSTARRVSSAVLFVTLAGVIGLLPTYVGRIRAALAPPSSVSAPPTRNPKQHLVAQVHAQTPESGAPGSAAVTTSAPSPILASASPTVSPGLLERAVVGRTRSRSRRSGDGSKPGSEVLSSSSEQAAPSAEPQDLATPAEALALSQLQQRPAPQVSPAPMLPAAVSPGPTATPARNTGPRLFPSKVAHQLLAIDPNTEPYFVRRSKALQNGPETLAATVQICVTPSGMVSSVQVLRPASPAVDRQIPTVLSRWRYRPMMENGQPVPFCYVLRYEI